MSYPRTNIGRALLNVEPDTNGGCWLWSGSMFRHGYGSVQVMKRRRLAHRYIYEQLRGPIPEGFSLLHKCDVRLCVNPDHLFLGTNAQNSADCVSKGRHVSMRGSSHSMAKVTESDIAQIRSLWAAREMTQAQIGARFGVSQSNVSMIVRGVTWGAVSAPDPARALRHILSLIDSGGDPHQVIEAISAAARQGLVVEPSALGRAA